jgi:hypothetical protein
MKLSAAVETHVCAVAVGRSRPIAGFTGIILSVATENFRLGFFLGYFAMKRVDDARFGADDIAAAEEPFGLTGGIYVRIVVAFLAWIVEAVAAKLGRHF